MGHMKAGEQFHTRNVCLLIKYLTCGVRSRDLDVHQWHIVTPLLNFSESYSCKQQNNPSHISRAVLNIGKIGSEILTAICNIVLCVERIVWYLI